MLLRRSAARVASVLLVLLVLAAFDMAARWGSPDVPPPEPPAVSAAAADAYLSARAERPALRAQSPSATGTPTATASSLAPGPAAASVAAAAPVDADADATRLFDDWRASRLAPWLAEHQRTTAAGENVGRVAAYENAGRSGGLGDVVLGIVTTFVFAAVTGRRFVLASTSPAPLEAAYAPNAVDWRARLNDTVWRSGARRVNEWLNTPHDQLATVDVAAAHAAAVEVFHTNQRGFVALLRNPAARAALQRHGLDALQPPLTYAEVASAALAFLFTPTPRLAAAVARNVRALRVATGTGSAVVSVHVRAGAGLGEDLPRMRAAAANLGAFACCAVAWADAAARPVTAAVFTDTEALRRRELYACDGAAVPAVFLNSTTCHFAPKDRPAKAACDADAPDAVLLATVAEWHTLAQVARESGGGLVLMRSNFGETASWLHRGTRRLKVPFDDCGGGRWRAPPRPELDYALDTPGEDIPRHEMGTNDVGF